MVWRAVSIGIGVIGALSMMVVVSVPADATNPPVVKVRPDTGLSSTATVKVSGKNLGDNKRVAMLECTAADVSEGGCNGDVYSTATTSSTGTLAKTDLVVNETFSTSDGLINCATGQDQCGRLRGHHQDAKVPWHRADHVCTLTVGNGAGIISRVRESGFGTLHPSTLQRRRKRSVTAPYRRYMAPPCEHTWARG